MIQLITPDQYGESGQKLAEMYRLRYRVFKERLDCDVQVSGGMEMDEFDALHPAYLLQRRDDGQIQGCVRLLPSTGPTMLGETFAELLDSQVPPADTTVWESGRFAHDLDRDGAPVARSIAKATYELFAGMIEFGLWRRLTAIVTVTDVRVERILRRAGWPFSGSAAPRRSTPPSRWRAIWTSCSRVSDESKAADASTARCSGCRSPWPPRAAEELDHQCSLTENGAKGRQPYTMRCMSVSQL